MRVQLLTQFEGLVQRYQKEIVSFHYRLVGNKFEAEDLAQDTFIKAYKNFETIKDQAKAKSWLYRVARNVAVDFFRRNQHREIALDASALEYYTQATAVDHEVQLVNSEVSKELAKCIEQLNADDKTIVKLLYYEGFSYKEICDMLRINQNTLKSRLHRARKSLLQIIEGNKLLYDIGFEYI